MVFFPRPGRQCIDFGSAQPHNIAGNVQRLLVLQHLQGPGRLRPQIGDDFVKLWNSRRLFTAQDAQSHRYQENMKPKLLPGIIRTAAHHMALMTKCSLVRW